MITRQFKNSWVNVSHSLIQEGTACYCDLWPTAHHMIWSAWARSALTTWSICKCVDQPWSQPSGPRLTGKHALWMLKWSYASFTTPPSTVTSREPSWPPTQTTDCCRTAGRDSAVKQLNLTGKGGRAHGSKTTLRFGGLISNNNHRPHTWYLAPPHLPASPRLVPEQVAAHTDDSVPGSLQTNVALEGGPVPLALSAAAAARPVAVVAALPGRESSSAGRPAVTRGPGIRGRHNVYCVQVRKVTHDQPKPHGPDPS